MQLFSLFFLFGICGIFYFTAIPNLYLLWGLTLLFLFLHFTLQTKWSPLLLALCFGLSWVMFTTYLQLEKQLPQEAEGKTLMVKGKILSLPHQTQESTKFLFKITEIVPKKWRIKTPLTVKLNWYHCFQPLYAGEKWQLAIRLKRPHGFRNPGSLDYEKVLFQKNIQATGYIVSKLNNKQISKARYGTIHLRQTLKNKINQIRTDNPLTPFLLALILGDRAGITQKQWQVFRQTGTSHLIAISGLHIGLLSGFIFFIIQFLWKRIPFLTLRLPSKQAAAMISLLTALFYSLLAGFTLPTQRAFIMTTVIFGSIMIKRCISSGYSISLALMLILLLHPLSVLDTGFWLSFSCVTLIAYGLFGRLNPKGLWWKWGRGQWVITIGLFPILLWSFHGLSLIAPLANSIAIPWVGFIILPLSFLGTLSLYLNQWIGQTVLSLALQNLEWLYAFLDLLSKISFSTVPFHIPNLLLFGLVLIAVLLFLAPRGFFGRYLSPLFLLPLITFKGEAPQPNEVWFTLFDVGQGLASLVQTKNHTLIFDAGPRFSESFDAGSAVIVPYLQLKRLHKIDTLVISHGDNDHIGGAKAILQGALVKEILSSVPKRFKNTKANYCHQGQSWNWDGVQFTMVSPKKGNYFKGNNSSCVLNIKVGKNNLLLTGDIEKQTEKELLQKKDLYSKKTILIAPHHGSKTSSTWPFVQATHPYIVLFPIGYRNRFRFPHKIVIKRYQKIGAILYDTAKSGAIMLRLDRDGIRNLTRYRVQNHHLWHISFLHSPD